MLTPAADDGLFDDLRAREFARLDEQGIAYLDHTGAALYGRSQALAYAERLGRGVFGNPHSEHAPSKASEAHLDAARAATLAFLAADPDLYTVCFTANATAAIKLVGESYPFSPNRALVVTADNHNSVNGMRLFAARRGAATHVLPLASNLSLHEPEAHLDGIAARSEGGLFAFPAQSNFAGSRHPMSLVEGAQARGFDVLIDAAGGGPATSLSLRNTPADFVALSFYKLFGLPTGVGALVARRTALERLERPWFAGGAVHFVSVAHARHRLIDGHAGFEDGTPNFLDIAALQDSFEFLARIPRQALQARLERTTRAAVTALRALRHPDGAPQVRLYGTPDAPGHTGCVAFNLLTPEGDVVAYQAVEAWTREAGVALRGGCFCNPGAAERAFDFDRHDLPAALDALDDDGFTPERLSQALGPQATVGALRLSVGPATNADDIRRAIEALATLRYVS
jgi:selenocysteine lyase/cysteine desulfurase